MQIMEVEAPHIDDKQEDIYEENKEETDTSTDDLIIPPPKVINELPQELKTKMSPLLE